MAGRPTLQRLVDVALAALVATVGLLEIWLPMPSLAGSGSRPFSTAVVVLMCAALSLRRAYPLPVLLVLVTAFVAGLLTGELYVLFWGGFLPFAVAVFSVARNGRGNAPFLGAAAAAATLLCIDLFVEELQAVSEIVFHWLVITVVWSFGWGLQVLERQAAASTRRAVEAEVTAAERALAAVVEERTRIARELHDVVAHAVSLMVVQAGAAEQVVDEDPAYVRTALGTIRTTGSGALSEMRRVVSMLREDGRGELAPQPGLAALPALLDDVRASGLDVTLRTDGEPRTLSAGLDLATFRIVQEALTNVRRHAGASRAEVLLRYDVNEVEVCVTDDGLGASHEAASDGHGLVGMRERAALYGGRVETKSRKGSGFTVRAVLPAS